MSILRQNFQGSELVGFGKVQDNILRLGGHSKSKVRGEFWWAIYYPKKIALFPDEQVVCSNNLLTKKS